MIPSNTEILFALGLNEEVIGVKIMIIIQLKLLEKEKIGGIEFNVEKIIRLNPEIVFAHELAIGIGMKEFNKFAMRESVFVVKNAADFEETYETIETIGKATGKTEEADEIIEDMKAKVDEVVAKKAQLKRKRQFL